MRDRAKEWRTYPSLEGLHITFYYQVYYALQHLSGSGSGGVVREAYLAASVYFNVYALSVYLILTMPPSSSAALAYSGNLPGVVIPLV